MPVGDPCTICGGGPIQRTRVRLHGRFFVAVGIGAMLASILALLLLAFMWSTDSRAEKAEAVSATDIRRALEKLSVPEEIVKQVLSAHDVSDAERLRLSDAQRQVIRSAESTMTAKAFSPRGRRDFKGFLTTTALGAVALGWMFLRKTDVLKCSSCGATLAGSTCGQETA